MDTVVDITLINLFDTVRRKTMDLCAPLATEDYVVQPVYYTSPIKWHIAHTTWFFEQMVLKKYFNEYAEFDSKFHFLFNSYYNTLGERTLRSDRGSITRPTVNYVMKYREHVDEYILKLL